MKPNVRRSNWLKYVGLFVSLTVVFVLFQNCDFVAEKKVASFADRLPIQYMLVASSQDTKMKRPNGGEESDNNLLTLNILSLNEGTVVGSHALMSLDQSVSHILASCDFDGRPRNDILWRDQDGNLSIRFIDDTKDHKEKLTINLEDLGLNSEWNIIGCGDFNGDGYSDIFFNNGQSGQSKVMMRTNSSGMDLLPPQLFTVEAVEAKPRDMSKLSVITSGDINDDRKNDLVLYDNTTGSVEIWYMDGFNAAIKSIPGVPPYPCPHNEGTECDPRPQAPDWYLAGVGDFDGDGRKDDLFWRGVVAFDHLEPNSNPNGPRGTYVWFLQDSQIVSQNPGTIAPKEWEPMEIKDYNADGVSDVAWRNKNTNILFIHKMRYPQLEKPDEVFVDAKFADSKLDIIPGF